jgi:hypothetical protein
MQEIITHLAKLPQLNFLPLCASMIEINSFDKRRAEKREIGLETSINEACCQVQVHSYQKSKAMLLNFGGCENHPGDLLKPRVLRGSDPIHLTGAQEFAFPSPFMWFKCVPHFENHLLKI